MTDDGRSSSNAVQEFQYTSPVYPPRFLEGLNLLRKECRFSDISISVGNELFNAHRVVLAASSPYFSAMFRNGHKENEVNVVEFGGRTTPIIFRKLLDFIYTGGIVISSEHVQELLVAADMFQLAELVSGCVLFFEREMDITNAVGIYRFAECHSFKELSNFALKFIYNNFIAVCKEEEFLELPKDYVLQLLSSEYLRVDTEVQVFDAALRWIQHATKERLPYVFDVLGRVRLPLIGYAQAERTIAECSDTSVRLALKSVWRDVREKRGHLAAVAAQPRLRAKKCIYLVGGSRKTDVLTWSPHTECTIELVEKYDTYDKTWSAVKPMKIGRILPGIATLNGKIFVVGGEQESQILANGECYDPLEDQWTMIDSMIVPRCEFGLTALNGYLYAFGGWVGDDIGGTIERYDPSKNKWGLYGSLAEPRFSMGVVSYEGLIYIVGGCTHNTRYHSDLLSYNPVTGVWEKLASMLTPRSQMGVAILDEHLYVVGGTNKDEVLQSVEKYSFAKNKWYKVPPMKESRACPAVAAVDSYLYAIGGDRTHEVNFYRAQKSMASVERYSVLNKVWKECPPLSESRSEAGAVVA